MSLSAEYFFLTVILLFIMTLLTSYYGWQQRRYFYISIVINLFSLLAAFSPAPQDLALERFSFILLGSLFVMIPRFIFYMQERRHSVFYAKVLFFQRLRKLYSLIFYSAKSSSRLWSGELEESHFQIIWSDCLSALKAYKTKVPSDYGNHLNRIWDLSLSLGSLRYRLTDFTVLSMGQDEMRVLLNVLLAIVDSEIAPPSQNKHSILFESLQTAIQSFEQLYQSMLQTVAKEPLVLLLFIQDLYALKEEYEYAHH